MYFSPLLMQTLKIVLLHADYVKNTHTHVSPDAWVFPLQ